MRLPPELPSPTVHERLVTCVSALKRASSKRRSSETGHFEAGRCAGETDLHYLRALAEECASEHNRLREENAMLLAELLRLRPAGPCALAGGHGFAVERELRSSLVSVDSYGPDAESNLWSRRLSPAVPQPLPQAARPEPPPPPPQPPQQPQRTGGELDEEALHLPGLDPSAGSPQTSLVGSHQPFAGSSPALPRRPSAEVKESLPGTILEEEVDDHCLPLRLDGQVSQELRVAGWAEPAAVRPGSSENDTQPLNSLNSLSVRADGSLSSRAVRMRERAYLFMRGAIQSRLWDSVGVISLIFALFGGSLWVVLDVPDRPGTAVLDAVQTTVMILFMIEVLVNSIVLAKRYLFTFFFWMDCLGTMSMVFEISFLLGGLGSDPTGTGNNNSLLLRSARAAKVGARVGRLSKILKCFVIFQKSRQRNSDRDRPNEPQPQERLVEAKVLSKILMLNLSTKVSLLTFLLVLVVPLFSIGQYPEVDLSMQVWADRLEVELSGVLSGLTSGSLSLANATNVFQGVINEMLDSYRDANVNYFPYNIEGYSTTPWVDGVQVSFDLDALLSGDRPRRRRNVLRQEVTRCLVQRPMCNGDSLAFVDFNFQAPHQLESTMDMVMIVFIITVMVIATGNLSHTLDGMLVKPVEKMLGMVVSMASQLLSQFHKIHGVMESEEEEDEDTQRAETEVLEAIFQKLARMARLAAERNVASEEEIQSMDAEGRGVIVEMLSLQPKAGAKHNSLTGRPEDGLSSMALWGVRTSGPALLPGNEAIVDVHSLPVSEDVIETFELDVLQFDNERLEKIILYIFFDSQLGFAGRRANVRLETFLLFHQTVRSEYNDLPYHSYSHACDVLHTVFRLLCMTFGPRWLSKTQQYALLIAALCHDVGHEGRTNPFLVETGHELALRYNDLSPLENMHCARLFDICSREGSNVFGGMDTNGRREARRVCVATILHTDNAKHFDMVKEINQIYEMASEICEAQAAFAATGEDPPLSHPYEAMVLQKDSLTWLELFLHLADCSNPLKPFRMCQCWADRILAEFFVQGDAEKELGIPVGMLNDRDKVNRAGSQHGFINFLVAPLVTCTVRLFPTLYPLATQMASNLEAWRHLWVAQSHPSADELAKRDAEVQKVREVAQQLQARIDSRRSSRTSTRSP